MEKGSKFLVDPELPYSKKNCKYSHYGAGFCCRYKHPPYDKYLRKIGKLDIVDSFISDEEEQDVIETLRLSLKNRKNFYANAKPYMKKKMKQYVKDLEF